MAGIETKSMSLVRINKYIASSTLYSRREADRMILEGRVELNGEKVTEQGVKIDPNNDAIFIDGNPLPEAEPEIIKFYKPRGVLTAYGEGRGKATLDQFPVFAGRKLPYSGRLDYESEGLVIFTNDGELIHRMQKPEFKIEKEYVVTVDRMLTDGEMKDFAGGMETSKGIFQSCFIFKTGKRNYNVIIKEGKKRQIRNMFAYFGSTVKRLIRIRIGNILLEDMVSGECRKLTPKEIRELYKCTGLK